ncbi:MAG: transporter substrate-binding domain-containing protein [Tissierellales bacterium]|nr:transporter substrate-binding domain-containing protein [Tissierellales bacterium]
MKRRQSFLLILSMVVLLLIVGCSEKSAEEKELVVGMELAYPPFEMTDADGNPTGISVDLAKALGEELGRNVRIENMAFGGLLPALQTGKIDIILSSMTITEEREEAVDFTIPYANSYLALLINKESEVNEFKDLDKEGLVLAVKKGTTGHLYAQTHLENATINVFDKETACVLEVTQGKADAFIYDQMTIYKNWKNNEQTTRLNLEPFQEENEKWGMALRSDDDELREKVNAFIEKYKENGGFEALAEKYLKEQQELFKKLNIPFFF